MQFSYLPNIGFCDIFAYYPPINVVTSAGPSDAITLWLGDFDESSNHHLRKSYGRVIEEVQKSPYAQY